MTLTGLEALVLKQMFILYLHVWYSYWTKLNGKTDAVNMWCMQFDDLMEARRKSAFTTLSGLLIACGRLRPAGEKDWEVNIENRVVWMKKYVAPAMQSRQPVIIKTETCFTCHVGNRLWEKTRTMAWNTICISLKENAELSQEKKVCQINPLLEARKIIPVTDNVSNVCMCWRTTKCAEAQWVKVRPTSRTQEAP